MRLFELFDKIKTNLDIPRDQMPQISRKDLDGHDIEKIQLPMDSLTPCQSQRVPGLVDQSVEQIQHRGSVKPLIVDRDCRIVNGHHRWDACKQLDIKTVPVIQVQDATVWDLIEEFSHATSDEFAESQYPVDLDEAKMPLYKVIEFFLQFHRKYGGDPQRNLWKVSRIADVNYRDLERELHQQIARGSVPSELGFRKDLTAMENLYHINEIERNPKMNHVIDYRDWADYKNTMKKTGKSIEGYNIWTDGANLVLESPETGEPAGVLATDDFSGMKQVAIELKPDLRGKDIAVRLYLFAIETLGWDIVSDGEQSLGSELMWDKLAHIVNVYVWDADKRKIIGKYNPADKKHVYDDDHYHIRLVATKTNARSNKYEIHRDS